MLINMQKKPYLKDKLEWLFPKYHKMLISINFIDREELYDLKIEDLSSIYLTMETEWKLTPSIQLNI